MTDHNRGQLILALPDESATRALGACIATGLSPALAPELVTSLRIYLHGDLGAGKTTLVQGLLAALGYKGRVKSPTYTLVELYAISRLHLYHFDFYRFQDYNEWREAGFSDIFGGTCGACICLVEWPEKAGDELPEADLDITLELDNTGRRATMVARSMAGAKCFDLLARCNSQKKSS